MGLLTVQYCSLWHLGLSADDTRLAKASEGLWCQTRCSHCRDAPVGRIAFEAVCCPVIIPVSDFEPKNLLTEKIIFQWVKQNIEMSSEACSAIGSLGL